jgi:hypothetical protein
VKTFMIWGALFVVIALLLLVFVAPQWTLHRREALYAYTHWLREPSAITKAEYDRQMARNHLIQYEFAAIGSLLVCGTLFGADRLAKMIPDKP